MRVFLVVSMIVLLFETTTVFASPLDEFNKQAASKASELESFSQILQGDDVTKRRLAIEFLLKQKDPDFQRLGKEVGLFSPDAVMQNKTLQAIFDGQPRLRMTITPTDDGEPSHLFRWVIDAGGSHDGKTATVSVLVGQYDKNKKCWVNPGRSSRVICRLTLGGTTVNLWSGSTSSRLSLKTDGSMRGSIQYKMNSQRGWGDVVIDLLD